jgi:hypothetical protein
VWRIDKMLRRIIKKLADSFGYEIKKKENFDTFFQIDPLFNDLYRKAQIHTQMETTDNELRRQRHYVLNYLLRSADLRTGNVCELGCWRGLSSYQIATYLKQQNADRIFHIFDSKNAIFVFTGEGAREFEGVRIYSISQRMDT